MQTGEPEGAERSVGQASWRPIDRAGLPTPPIDIPSLIDFYQELVMGRIWVTAWLFVCLTMVAVACEDSGGTPTSSSTFSTSMATTSSTSNTTTSTTVPPPGEAPWPTEAWPVSTPEEQGMSSGVLADLVESAIGFGGIDSVMIVRNGYVVLDTVFYPFPEDTAHQTHSATKSFTGTLIGMAIDRGLLAGVDVPVVELLPEAAPAAVDDLKASMTVEDLLTMTSGLDCQDSLEYGWRGYVEMAESDDWVAHVLALPMRHEPGTYFEYCNGASVVLSAIVSEVTGKTAAEFAEDVLFGPLGITDFEWVTVPPGISNGEDSLYLRPHDMAKLGYLYLRGGEWDGEQVLPKEWVEAATAERIQELYPPYYGYGYQWWVLYDAYQAAGLGGQIIRVIPQNDLVVVFTAGMEAMEEVGRLDYFIAWYVLPAVVSDAPLPADPDAHDRLAAAVAAAAAEPEPAVAALPDIASEVDGVWFEARDNEEGWKGFQVDFFDDTATLIWEDAAGVQKFPIGLDGCYRVDDSGLLALRGKWQSEDTFVVHVYQIGEAMRRTEQWEYEGNTVTRRRRNLVTAESAEYVADRVD